MKTLVLLGAITLAFGLVGCNGDPAPVQGDNPAAAGGVVGTKDRASNRGGFNQTHNPPGTGRGGAGKDLGAGP